MNSWKEIYIIPWEIEGKLRYRVNRQNENMVQNEQIERSYVYSEQIQRKNVE